MTVRAIIDTTGLERLPVRIAVAPNSDAVLMTMDAFGAIDGRTSPGQRQHVRQILRRSSRAGIRLFGTSGPRPVWDGLLPLLHADHRSHRRFDLINRDADQFRTELTWWFGDHGPTSCWRRVLSRPHLFFDAFTKDARDLGVALLSHRGNPQPLLEREAQRLHTAVSRGALREYLVSLMPDAIVRGPLISVPAMRPVTVRLAPSGIALAPTLSGVRCGIYSSSTDSGLIDGIQYPLPDIGRRADDLPTRPPADSMAALIGTHRTVLLRDLVRPTTCGELATRMHVSPGAITHHVDALVAAGLVVRERCGRTVLISRTARGEGLLGLYGV